MLKHIENIHAHTSPIAIGMLLHLYGIDVRVSRPVETVESSIYGQYAGTVVDESVEDSIKILLTGDLYSMVFGSSSDMGIFGEQKVYSKAEVEVGSTLVIDRPDGISINFMIEDMNKLGATQHVIICYKLSYVET